jgi:hypothetical protein
MRIAVITLAGTMVLGTGCQATGDGHLRVRNRSRSTCVLAASLGDELATAVPGPDGMHEVAVPEGSYRVAMLIAGKRADGGERPECTFAFSESCLASVTSLDKTVVVFAGELLEFDFVDVVGADGALQPAPVCPTR